MLAWRKITPSLDTSIYNIKALTHQTGQLLVRVGPLPSVRRPCRCSISHSVAPHLPYRLFFGQIQHAELAAEPDSERKTLTGSSTQRKRRETK